MPEENTKIITASELAEYLNSLDKQKENEKSKKIHEYKIQCNAKSQKVSKKEISKIEKIINKKYEEEFELREKIYNLLKEIKKIPEKIEKLKVTEYMLYRVDIRKAEKIVNKAEKRLNKRYETIQSEIEESIEKFPELETIEKVDYTEYQEGMGKQLENAKEKYKLEYTEEERSELVKKELDIVEQVKTFNSIPIPHEILKNSDRDIQTKMQKFNNIRQKRIKILLSMPDDYKKLIDPRKETNFVNDALNNIDLAKDILIKSEYNAVENSLIKRKKKIKKSTNEIKMIISAKEKKTGILNFNIQQARYLRMEVLRKTILESSSLIEKYPTDELEEQLEKLKALYEREKQFASVIQKLNDEKYETENPELKAYEEQIYNLQTKLTNSRKIKKEEQEKIDTAKKELLVLWKMEISSVTSKRKESFTMLAKTNETEANKRDNTKEEKGTKQSIYKKIKKLPRGGKHACT